VIKVGDKIKDNDPRIGNRVLTVEAVSNTHVTACETSGVRRPVRIKKSRIYTDGKPRRSGFDLLL